jgi:hypothetical protein
MAELADAHPLKGCVLGRAGSTPASGTPSDIRESEGRRLKVNVLLIILGVLAAIALVMFILGRR